MKPYATPCVFAAVVTTLAACGSQNRSEPSSTAPLTTTGKAAPASSPTTTEPELINELVGFTSPGGNVGCYIASTSARCNISERDWSPPPRPADCEFDYGQGITLSPGGEASFICA